MTQQTKIPEELVPLLAPLEIWDFDEVALPADRKSSIQVGGGSSETAAASGEWTSKLVAYPKGNADRAFYWRSQRSAFDSLSEQAAKRATEQQAAMHLLGLLAARVGIRLSAEHNWRALAANPVWHKQFGPAVAVASDGVRVVLLREARLNADFFLAHITNCIGHVTSTPTPTEASLQPHAGGKPKAQSASAKLLAKLADED